jgi:uncharacterized protein (DUF302 family)
MYAFSLELAIPVTDFDDAVEKVKAALMAEKMGIVSDINVQAIFKAKMDLDIPGYRILGACVAPLAKRVIEIDPDAGALLPCNVVVRATADKRIIVAFMHPQHVLGLAAHPSIDAVAEEALYMLQRVQTRLSA